MAVPEFYHVSVMLMETVDSLDIAPESDHSRTFIDCTGGKGGHSAEILSRLGENDRHIIIDQDPDAIAVLTERFKDDKRVTIVKNNFSNIKQIAEDLGLNEVDGIIADLGVSSFQLDNAERGFSYMKDAPLDMRMSKEGTSAYDIVNNYTERELANILFQYGEEKCSRQIARAIVNARAQKPVETTLELAELIKNAVPAAVRRKSTHHVAKKSFQAIRIATNDELNRLKNSLDDMFNLLCVGGRLSIITFHSLEDRITKQNFAKHTEGCTCPREFPVCICGKTPEGRVFKFRKPSETELEVNPRSRSAVLRTIERIK